MSAISAVSPGLVAIGARNLQYQEVTHLDVYIMGNTGIQIGNMDIVRSKICRPQPWHGHLGSNPGKETLNQSEAVHNRKVIELLSHACQKAGRRLGEKVQIDNFDNEFKLLVSRTVVVVANEGGLPYLDHCLTLPPSSELLGELQRKQERRALSRASGSIMRYALFRRVILYPETSAKAKRAKKTQRRYASSPVKEQCRSPVETVYSTCVHWHEHLRHPALGVLQKDMAPDGYSVDSRIWTIKPSEAGRNHSIMISCLALHWCRSGEAIREIFVGAWGSSFSEGEDWDFCTCPVQWMHGRW
ncbi:hypothetical protein EDB83DRAFT_2321174 [Lactarius deliciosus]|nr:hypothetical protein EDB83DRAFT_2321174 [Lactarius deliciosus]